MKKHHSFLFAVLIFFSISTFAQDKIKLKSGETKEVFITYKTNKETHYIRSETLEGPTFSISNRRLSQIIYDNGEIDDLWNSNPRLNRNFGLYTGLGFVNNFDGLIFLKASYFINHFVELDFAYGNSGGGLMSTNYRAFGTKLHLNKINSKSGFTPFLGLSAGFYEDSFFLQIPYGILYTSKFGLSAGLSFNEVFFLDGGPSSELNFIEISIGWRLKGF